MLVKTLMLLAATVVSAETQNLRSVADLDAGSSKSKSIWDRLTKDSSLSTLVTALKAADLVDTLSGTGPFTVLAPTNQAFANVPAGTLAALLKPQNKAELVDLLTYHVLPGVVPFKTDGEGPSHFTNVKKGDFPASVKSAEGESVTTTVCPINTAGGARHGLCFNGKNTYNRYSRTSGKTTLLGEQNNIKASNGLIHYIDGVLMVPTPAGKSIVELALATPELSTLVTALKAADLVDTLSGKGPFTVFAPTNDAFNKLPANVLAGLLKPEHKAQLVDILTYHVASGDVHSTDLTDQEMIPTVEGKDVEARVSSSAIFINSAKVTAADNDATNGVVHIIDAVLMPPPTPTPAGKNIVELALATPELSVLVRALKAAGLVDTLTGKGPFTVFAPSNDAFNRLPYGVLDSILKNKTQLVDLLTYHVVSGDVQAKDLFNNELIPTVEGKNVTARVNGDGIFINAVDNGDGSVSGKVIAADNAATNGVVHIIDAVLMPNDAPGPDQNEHLWFRGWTSKGLPGFWQCGEIDAGPRMPRAIFDPSNKAALKAYEDITIALYGFEPYNTREHSVILELGRCLENNYTKPGGHKTVDWTGDQGQLPSKIQPLMDGICQVKCECNFEGANKTVSQLPTCKDEPDDPKAAKWCSLCGPKFNANIDINLFECGKSGIIKDVCPGPKNVPGSRAKAWEQVLKDLLGNL